MSKYSHLKIIHLSFLTDFPLCFKFESHSGADLDRERLHQNFLLPRVSSRTRYSNFFNISRVSLSKYIRHNGLLLYFPSEHIKVGSNNGSSMLDICISKDIVAIMVLNELSSDGKSFVRWLCQLQKHPQQKCFLVSPQSLPCRKPPNKLPNPNQL